MPAARPRRRARANGVALACLLIAACGWARSQATDDTESYMVVTLEDMSVEQKAPTFAPVELRLMLGTVAASGSRVQQHAWPAAIWSESTPGDLLAGDGAIPLFALPEAQMGKELGFALIVLDNRVPPEQFPDNWLHNVMPTVVEAAAGPLALWVSEQTLSPDETAARISTLITPLLGANAELGVIAAKFTQDQDWGVSDQVYESGLEDEVLAFRFTYRVQRVTVSTAARVEVLLQRLTLEAAQDAAGAEVFLWAQVASGFIGERAQGSRRRLPLEGQYPLKVEDSVDDEQILYVGALGPFLYFNVSAWNQGAEGIVALSNLTRLWTLGTLAAAPASDLQITLLGPQGQLTLTLSVRVTGLLPP